MGEFASRGVGNAGLTTGIIGTATGGLALLRELSNNGGLSGIFGGGDNVSKTELAMSQQLAAKDSEIGLLKSQVYVDQKLVDAIAYMDGKYNSLAAEVRANKDAQCAVNANQAVFNGTTTATISCIQGFVNELLGMTKRVIPNGNVCPGWGDVTVSVTPAAAATT